MKRKIMGILAGFIFAVLSAANGVAQGFPTFDMSNWLSAIDRVYQNYEMIENTINQIENQYKQIQQAIEMAKSIDWDNVKFDGDFDIRNDIKNATKRVNRLLNCARRVNQAVNTPSISCGETKYSIADLCGASAPDENGNHRTLLTGIKETATYMSKNMKDAVKDVTEGLTYEQKQAIWAKYGISPANYALVQQSTGMVMKSASNILGSIGQDVHSEKLKEISEKNNAMIEAAMNNVDSNGNPTQAGMIQTILQFMTQLEEGIGQLDNSVREAAAPAANALIQDEQRREVDAARNAQASRNNEVKESRISGRARR